MPPRSIRAVTKDLQPYFTTSKPTLSLPPEARRLIQQYVDEHDAETSEEEYTRANEELNGFWARHVHKSPEKRGAFVGVLRGIRPAVGDGDLLLWWLEVVKPIVGSTRYDSAAQDDAREFTVGVMIGDSDGDDTAGQIRSRARVCRELLDLYVARNQPLPGEDAEQSAEENTQVAKQAEDVLIAFGRKRPKDLFHHLDDLIRPAGRRLIALKLLTSFIRLDIPHLYLVINTPLVEDLLKCLMNDTATELLSVALKALIMLLPHIPGSLGPYLPRLFLVYSRLLCWEKFSEYNTEAERSIVKDDRVSTTDDDEEDEAQDVGFDSTWEKARPAEGVVEASTPEILTYFTYLYGLYPLNLVSYIRKPRRYLKDINFPAADSFDLDQAVIRSRSEQFRAVHFLHPNFYNMTIEEEVSDPKWPKMDPADVVGECHGLCMTVQTTTSSLGPPPNRKLPAIPPVPPLSAASAGGPSPTTSHRSLRSGSSWRDAQPVATSNAGDADSPVLKPQLAPAQDPEPQHEKPSVPLDNLAYLQREITLLQNDLNFERWHKAQYSNHIGKIFQRNVKQATAEAETFNLIYANRALQKQLDQMRKAREATQKDAALTRKQANTLEANMMERFNKMRLEQETWKADADELRRLRSEMHEYRDLLVASEARELKKSHQLQIAEQELEKLQKIQEQVTTARQELRVYKFREAEYAITKRQNEMLQGEHEKTQEQVRRLEQDQARLRHAFATKVADLETQRGLSDTSSGYSGSQPGADLHVAVQRAVAESEAKLAQLKKSYSKLVAEHTDLELEYQTLKNRLEILQGAASAPSVSSTASDSFGYEIVDDYAARISTSDPTHRRSQQPVPGTAVTKGADPTTVNSFAGLMFDPRASKGSSTVSGSGRSKELAAFNQSAPVAQDEDVSSAFSDYSGTGSQGQPVRKEKIQPGSSVRVYGRGGAQNIKLKQKEEKKAEGAGGKKSSALKGLRNFM
ncbi:uncharacterized protein LTR77_009006 [Saxophila tyrrhenica]|uniref:Hamartin n=1 Tax=Saxophila tyrrhenica TaxID=1690608 RepID=A0AAV9P046_9PEZI|nr:hypothetical protein LTR77_009006 [Saxophila tyrrhenica]